MIQNITKWNDSKQKCCLNVYSGQCPYPRLTCPQACHLNWKTQQYQRHIIGLKIPTGGRQTSLLFTSIARSWTWVYRETTPAKWSERDSNPQSRDFKSRALTSLSCSHAASSTPCVCFVSYSDLFQCLLTLTSKILTRACCRVHFISGVKRWPLLGSETWQRVS